MPVVATVVARRTLDTDFCIEALEEALQRFGAPEIFIPFFHRRTPGIKITRGAGWSYGSKITASRRSCVSPRPITAPRMPVDAASLTARRCRALECAGRGCRRLRQLFVVQFARRDHRRTAGIACSRHPDLSVCRRRGSHGARFGRRWLSFRRHPTSDFERDGSGTSRARPRSGAKEPRYPRKRLKGVSLFCSSPPLTRRPLMLIPRVQQRIKERPHYKRLRPK